MMPPNFPALFTGLYEVTMAQAYVAEHMSATAVFETLFRKLPPGRSYVVAAGLSDVLDYLEALQFQPDDIDYLQGLRLFTEESRSRCPQCASLAMCGRCRKERWSFRTSRSCR